MHPAFDGDVGVGEGGSKQFAERAEEKDVAGGDGAAFGEGVAELFEDGVLEDGIYDEDEGWEDAGEEGEGT